MQGTQGSETLKQQDAGKAVSEETRNLIEIRDLKPLDVHFVYATWLKGLYYGNDWFREIPQDLYFERYHPVVGAILKKPGVFVRVACLKDETDVILGYAVLERKTDTATTLHWAFTKQAWRKIGIMKSLIPEGVTQVSHLTKIGKALKPTHWQFNPFL